MKKYTCSSFRILLTGTGLVFLLLLLTMVLSNAVILLGIRLGFIVGKPDSPLIPFLIQSGLISICVGTVLTFVLSRVPLRPVNTLIRAIHDVAGGRFNTKINLKHPREFRELSESFNQMTAELAGIEILRSDFIANFSHEFRTPMVSILGFAKLLKKGNLSREEKEEYLDIIIEECSRLTALSSNVLNLSKVESLSCLTDVTVFQAGEQIREAILLLEQKWSKKNITFDLDIRESTLSGNRSLLKQVWVNLIDNAVKFSPENSIITVRTEICGSHFLFEIRDQGTGMDEATCARIFERFYQADLSHATEGNGLGLSLVRKITELHGGSVEVRSIPGEGSTFTVILPAWRSLPRRAE